MSPGGGELSLSVCPGVGNRTSSTQVPGGVPGGGGMVTGRIEPRITCFTEAAEAIAMLSRSVFKIIVCCQFRTVYSDLIFAWFARLRVSNFKMRDSETSFIFSSSRFRDSSLRRRDFETRLKFAETHYF